MNRADRENGARDRMRSDDRSARPHRDRARTVGAPTIPVIHDRALRSLATPHRGRIARAEAGKKFLSKKDRPISGRSLFPYGVK